MDQATDLAKLYPTTRLPTRPGPSVVETISISEICKFALFNDAWNIFLIISACALDATSGTTPPNFSCISTCDEIVFTNNSSPFNIAIAVSSHDVSNPRIILSSSINFLQVK